MKHGYSLIQVDNRAAMESISKELRHTVSQVTYEETRYNLNETLHTVCSEFLKRESPKRVYIYISFLRTRMLEHDPNYRVDLYDENWYLDPNECSFFWNVEGVFGKLFENIKVLHGKIAKLFITDSDYDKLCLMACAELHRKLIKSIYDTMPTIQDLTALKDLSAKCPVQLWIGEYKDTAKLLYSSDEVRTVGFI